MKTKLLFTKQNSNAFYVLLVFCLCFNYGWSQQVLGEFPQNDGGMEGQTEDLTMSSKGSTNTPSTTDWSVSSTGNTNLRELRDDPSVARTGNFSIAMSLDPLKNNARVQTPSTEVGANPFLISTEYTVQYHWKSDADPSAAGYLDAGMYLNSTSGGVAGDVTNTTAFVADTWIKGYNTFTSGSAFHSYDDMGTTRYRNWACARISVGSGNEGIFLNTVFFDDFVVYAGAYDDAAPSDATTGTYDVAGNVGWTAPAGGVDGGGYVVFKYTALPDSSNGPNQNGIYQLGSTTSNGVGALLGTVVYIGTGITFNELYIPGTYYKVYAVDKAFNYSGELLISDTTLGIAESAFASKFSIYPNPAQDYIQIESNDIKVSSVDMYSLIGQKVISTKNLVNNRLDISSLNSGIYLLKVNADSGSLTKKIIVE